MALSLSPIGCSWLDAPRSAETQPAPAEETSDVPAAGSEATPAGASGPVTIEQAPPSTPGAATLSVLHVRLPASQRTAAERLWNYVREDVVPAPVALRLHENGFRVGIGHERTWNSVRQAIDEIDDRRSMQLDPVRLPPNYPLALELDSEPRDQTLFHVASDGVISGSTWAQSRNVLRVTFNPDFRGPGRALLNVTPEVRQRLDGWRWVRSESGLWQTPKYSGQAFDLVAVNVALEHNEFLLIAPGERAAANGLIGGAFLRSEIDGVVQESYIFLKLDVADAGSRSQLGR
ncbi:MAG: hypothetical protein U1D55_08175 [Phycisphaerae bacterium]